MLLVRAPGNGSGRFYKLGYEGRYRAGNTAACSTTVTVPHNNSHEQSRGAAARIIGHNDAAAHGLRSRRTRSRWAHSAHMERLVSIWPMVEGISVTGINPTGFTLNYGAFEEVSVATAAHGPEWHSPGVHMQFVSKSGGNQYRGTLYADFGFGDWQSFNRTRPPYTAKVPLQGLKSLRVAPSRRLTRWLASVSEG